MVNHIIKNYIIKKNIWKEDSFAEISKNLVRYKFENNFVGIYQNNYVQIQPYDDNIVKSFDILAITFYIIMKVQQNYFQIQLNFLILQKNLFYVRIYIYIYIYTLTLFLSLKLNFT